MKSFRRLILLTLSATLLSGCSLFEPVNNNPEEQQQDDVVSLKSITATGYTSYVYQNEIYSFDGKVTAYYSDSTSKEVTNYTVTPLDTSEAGNSPITISYSENNTKVESSIYISIISKGSENVPVTGVTLSETSKSIKVGESFTLNAYVAPSDATNKQVSWSSSNSSVATVNNGYVVAVSNGTTIITVSTVDGNKTAQCTVTVAESKVLVTSVTFTETSKSMVVGDTYDINYTVSPSNASDKSLTWSSSRSTVASVSSTGRITAKAAGTATITAKSNDGSNKRATITVTVSNPEVAVTGISLNKTSLSLKNGEQAQLTATVSPSNATDKAVTWSGSANGITVNSSGLVSVSSTATVGRTATIVATAHGNTSKTASCVVTVIETPVGEKDAWTIMIYMCGSTLEYDPSDREYGPNIGLASDDLMQILKSNAIPSDVNVLVETGGAGGWSLNKAYTTTQTTISSSKLQRWEVVSQKDSTSNNKLKPIETLTTNQMATQSSFQSFLDWGLTSYPAENTGVILWNHGGALAGVCYDENYSENTLNTIEVAKASENALAGKDIDKMTFIGYDACLMGVADIASVNASYYDYMVASEESEPGKGWDYTSFLNTLYSNKTNTKSNVESILDKICSSFVTENCDNDGCGQYYSGYGYYYCYSTLAVYDLSKMDTLVSAFETYATNIKKISGYYSKIVSAFSSNSNYVFGEGLYGTCDFIKFLGAMDSKFSSVSSTNLRSAINSLVIAKYNCDEYDFTPCGICAFVPEAIGEDASYYGLQCSEDDYTGAYASKFSTWQSMMLANW